MIDVYGLMKEVSTFVYVRIIGGVFQSLANMLFWDWVICTDAER